MSVEDPLVSFQRLKWHCRRGMLELDLLLEPFLEEVFMTLDKEDQKRFYQLIEEEDQDLFVWFMQKEVPNDPDLARIVKIILDRVQPQKHQV